MAMWVKGIHKNLLKESFPCNITRFLAGFIFFVAPCFPLLHGAPSPHAKIVTKDLHPQYHHIQSCLRDIQEHRAAGRDLVITASSLDTENLDLCPLVILFKKWHLLPKKTPSSLDWVKSALKTFQNFHALPETGLLDPQTLLALRGDAQPMIQALQRAANQWSLLGSMPHHYALVNIPAFYLYLMDRGRLALSSRVMVGKLDSRTPTFAGFIYSLVFNPQWIVPKTRYKDFMSQVGRDGFYVKNGCLFQKPGPKNHLGQVKFLTRRSDAIILHSTHEPELFSQKVRTFSLGCVRVENFADLARHVLEISGKKVPISHILKEKTNQAFALKDPFPLYVIYQRLWIKDGVVVQYSDVYGRNKKNPGNSLIKTKL